VTVERLFVRIGMKQFRIRIIGADYFFLNFQLFIFCTAGIFSASGRKSMGSSGMKLQRISK
jgi:hypothetical protein